MLTDYYSEINGITSYDTTTATPDMVQHTCVKVGYRKPLILRRLRRTTIPRGKTPLHFVNEKHKYPLVVL